MPIKMSPSETKETQVKTKVVENGTTIGTQTVSIATSISESRVLEFKIGEDTIVSMTPKCEGYFLTIHDSDSRLPHEYTVDSVKMGVRDGAFTAEISCDGKKYTCYVDATGVKLKDRDKPDEDVFSFEVPMIGRKAPQLIDVTMTASFFERAMNGDETIGFEDADDSKKATKLAPLITAYLTLQRKNSRDMSSMSLGGYEPFTFTPEDGKDYFFLKRGEDEFYVLSGGKAIPVLSYTLMVDDKDDRKRSLVLRVKKDKYVSISLPTDEAGQLSESVMRDYPRFASFAPRDHELDHVTSKEIDGLTYEVRNSTDTEREVRTPESISRTVHLTREEEESETPPPVEPRREETPAPAETADPARTPAETADPARTPAETADPARDPAAETADSARDPAETDSGDRTDAPAEKKPLFTATPMSSVDGKDVKVNLSPQWGNAAMLVGIFMILAGFLLGPFAAALMTVLGSAMVVGGGVFYITADRIANPYLKFDKYLFDPLSKQERSLENAMEQTYETQKTHAQALEHSGEAYDDFVGDVEMPGAIKEMFGKMGYSEEEAQEYWNKHFDQFIKDYAKLLAKTDAISPEEIKALFGRDAEFTPVDGITLDKSFLMEATGDRAGLPVEFAMPDSPFAKTFGFLYPSEASPSASVDNLARFVQFCGMDGLEVREELEVALEDYQKAIEGKSPDELTAMRDELSAMQDEIIQTFFREPSSPLFTAEQLEHARVALFDEHLPDTITSLKKINSAQYQVEVARKAQEDLILATGGELVKRVLTNPNAEESDLVQYATENAVAIARLMVYQDFSEAQTAQLLGRLPDEARKAIASALDEIDSASDEMIALTKEEKKLDKTLGRFTTYYTGLSSIEEAETRAAASPDEEYVSDKKIESSVRTYVYADSLEALSAEERITERTLSEADALTGGDAKSDYGAMLDSVKGMVDETAKESIKKSFKDRDEALQDSGIFLDETLSMRAGIDTKLTTTPTLSLEPSKLQVALDTRLRALLGGKVSDEVIDEILKPETTDSDFELKIDGIKDKSLKDQLIGTFKARKANSQILEIISTTTRLSDLAEKLNHYGAPEDDTKVYITPEEFPAKIEEFREKYARDLKGLGEEEQKAIARVVLAYEGRYATLESTKYNDDTHKSKMDVTVVPALIKLIRNGDLGLAVKRELLREGAIAVLESSLTAEAKEDISKGDSSAIGKEKAKASHELTEEMKLRQKQDLLIQELRIGKKLLSPSGEKIEESAVIEEIRACERWTDVKKVVVKYYGAQKFADGKTFEEELPKEVSESGTETHKDISSAGEKTVSRRKRRFLTYADRKETKCARTLGKEEVDYLRDKGEVEETSATSVSAKISKGLSALGRAVSSRISGPTPDEQIHNQEVALEGMHMVAGAVVKALETASGDPATRTPAEIEKQLSLISKLATTKGMEELCEGAIREMLGIAEDADIETLDSDKKKKYEEFKALHLEKVIKLPTPTSKTGKPFVIEDFIQSLKENFVVEEGRQAVALKGLREGAPGKAKKTVSKFTLKGRKKTLKKILEKGKEKTTEEIVMEENHPTEERDSESES